MERYGHYIAMDGMKRELNARNWCYLAVNVLNDCHETQVVIEALAIGERLEVYKFILNSLIRFTPTVSVNDIKICSSDAFLDLIFVRQFFPRCHFILDRYHLLENVKTRVGLSNWSKYEYHVKRWIHAKDEASFNKALQDIVAVCG